MSGLVSSILSMYLPLYLLTYSSFKMETRVWPRWSGPDGPGATRMTTLPSTAPGSSGSSCFLSVLVFLNRSRSEASARLRTSSTDRPAISRHTSSAVAATSFARDRSAGCSASTFPMTALGLALPPYRAAFWSAYFLMTSRRSADIARPSDNPLFYLSHLGLVQRACFSGGPPTGPLMRRGSRDKVPVVVTGRGEHVKGDGVLEHLDGMLHA
ncbi:MAG: hypothetical protein A4E29_01126 [Methanomassiliicoccales archaeon PtaB.Bin134]|nr:MAG: hypothetical protein A4E29_01126 [Methanomassiliicoccales archaeon PtaB.Bin134]